MLGFVPRFFGSRGIYSDQKVDTFIVGTVCFHILREMYNNVSAESHIFVTLRFKIGISA